MADAGRVAPIPKGDWSESESYEQLDMVTYGNKLWIAKQPSINIVPPDGDYWMLCLKNYSQEQLDGIIDGTTQVGNANKLDGHESDYYAKADELFQKPRSYDSLDFDNIIESGLYSGLGSPLDVGCANYPINATGLLIVFYHDAVPCQIYVTYTCVMYFRARFSTLNWSEWKTAATTADLANYLPLSNKPSGSYIGNGDAAQRLITVGGSGYALLIYSEKGSMWVSLKGAIGHKSDGTVHALAYNECCYYDESTLLIASDNSLVNESGVAYKYQVL